VREWNKLSVMASAQTRILPEGRILARISMQSLLSMSIENFKDPFDKKWLYVVTFFLVIHSLDKFVGCRCILVILHLIFLILFLN